MTNLKAEEEELNEGSIIAKRFKILNKLGEGGCGSVFKVEDLEQKGQMHAMKVEFNNTQATSILKMEVHILQEMEKKEHVAKLIASGKRNTFCYMVMTLLGKSLNSLVEKHGPYFNVSTQVRIGMCLVFGAKQIHDIGYIHRDLKPANIALGIKGSADERFFMVLDFGLARQYVTGTENGNVMMRRPRDRAYFRGTARYCSLAMHERSDQGRVDDLWAILYILAELRHKLPWADVVDKAQITEMKRDTPDAVLLSNSPIQLLEMAQYIRTLNYYDRPHYDKIYKMFEDIMKLGSYKWIDPYHWEKQTDRGRTTARRSKSQEKDGDSKSRRTRPKRVVSGSGSAQVSRRVKLAPATKDKEQVEEEKDVPMLTIEHFTGNPLGF